LDFAHLAPLEAARAQVLADAAADPRPASWIARSMLAEYRAGRRQSEVDDS